MALVSTTLSAACGAGDTLLSVTSTSSGFPAVGTYAQGTQVMRVDGEDMLVVTVPASGQVRVSARGYNGTVAVPHDTLAVVQTTTTPADWVDAPARGIVPRPPYMDDIVTIGQDTVFAAAGTVPSAGIQPYPVKDTTYIIDKATACAVTLIATGATTPAPSAASIGVRMRFMAATAQAHTVTYGPGFDGDTTTSDVATCNSKVGAVLDVVIGKGGLLAAVNASVNASTAQWTLG